MTSSTHPKLIEKYQHYVEKHPNDMGCTQDAILWYRKNLADEIGQLINHPNHPTLFFPLDRLEKAWLILNGIEE